MSYVRHVEDRPVEPSTRDQLERVVEAGQRMISSRFDLLSLEMKETIAGAVKMGVFTVLGAVLLLLGHIAGIVAAALGMSLVMPAWAAVLILAGIHFVLAGVFLVVGMKQPHSPKLAIKPEETRQAHRRLPSPVTGPVDHQRGPMIYRPQGT